MMEYRGFSGDFIGPSRPTVEMTGDQLTFDILCPLPVFFVGP
jgi:hypothetical protein